MKQGWLDEVDRVFAAVPPLDREVGGCTRCHTEVDDRLRYGPGERSGARSGRRRSRDVAGVPVRLPPGAPTRV
ncbi:hypothetical protein ACFV0L_07170 [Streptosporangium canum]|uniref:hypothetical protein n=1 Tax=Streptosporangium canum TaxID=324952 RepID=UPI0036B69362